MQDDIKNISLPLTFEVDDNFNSDRFIKLRLRFMHDGENPNGSFFQMENMEKAKPSLANIPILANVVVDKDGNVDHGSHDFHIEDDLINEGESRIIYDEKPIGVIPETNNYEVAKFDGKNYAYTDGYLWVGYAGYSEDIVKRDTEVKLSMEIEVQSYVYDSKTSLYNITDYTYKGITLLGKNTGTGMLNAKATTKSFSEDGKQELFALMSELKEDIVKNQSSNEVDINSKSFTKETEGEKLDESKINLLLKYNLKIEDLGFEIDELSLDDLEVKLKEFSKPETNFISTYNQKRDAIRNAVQGMKRSEDYEYYYLFDFDDNFAYVEKDSYSESGGFSETHGRIGYLFDDSKVEASITGEWEEIYLTYLTAAEKASLETKMAGFEATQKDFESYKTSHATDNTEVEELRTFKTNAFVEYRKEAEEELFEKFNKLNGNEEFEELKTKSSEFNLDILEEKCFALLGKTTANFSANTTKKKNLIKIPVSEGTSDESKNKYDIFFEKYKRN